MKHNPARAAPYLVDNQQATFPEDKKDEGTDNSQFTQCINPSIVQDSTLSPYHAVRFRECPFRDLESILSTTILLAYFGYGREVRNMMKQLS